MHVELEQTQLYFNYDKAVVDKIYTTIGMTAQDDAGNLVTKPVPCVFSTPERAFASIAKQIARRKGVTDIKDEDIKNIPLPIISVSRGDDVLDPKRYIMVKLQRLMYNAATGTYMGTLLPQPVDLTYQVDIWARNNKDIESIKNQFVLWLRYNEFYLHVTHPDPFGPRIVLTELRGIRDSSKVESLNEQRTLRRTLTFVVHGWLCSAPIYADVIRRAIVDIESYDPSELLAQVVVTADTTQSPEAVVVPPVEGVPTLKTSVYAALIPGAAEVDVTYGNFTAPSKLRVLGMQVAINGHPAEGDPLVLQIKLNDVLLTGKTTTVAAGLLRGATVFGSSFLVQAGDRLQVICVSSGTTQPAEWVEVQYDVEIETTL